MDVLITNRLSFVILRSVQETKYGCPGSERVQFVQGGSRNKKEYPGSNFLVRPSVLDLPTYVIRHMPIYSNMTSFS